MKIRNRSTIVGTFCMCIGLFLSSVGAHGVYAEYEIVNVHSDMASVPVSYIPPETSLAHEIGSMFAPVGTFLTKNLSLGMIGDEVKKLQEYLSTLPDIYPEGLVTGYFGDLTKTAVQRLQTKLGIESVGVVGPQTRAVIGNLAGVAYLSMNETGGTEGAVESSESIYTLPVEGFWCWFQDERAIVNSHDELFFTTQGLEGEMQVSTLNLKSGHFYNQILRENHVYAGSNPDKIRMSDDHNNAGLLYLPDNRITAFYTQHHTIDKMFMRTTSYQGPERVIAKALRPNWGEQTYFTSSHPRRNMTYADPFWIPAENKYYVFYRTNISVDGTPSAYNNVLTPHFSISGDGMRNWSQGLPLIKIPVGSKAKRPYVKYVSNNYDTIHFVYTNNHPSLFTSPTHGGERTSIYHAFYREGNLYRYSSNGREVLIGPLADGMSPQDGSLVYDGSIGHISWIWDVELDSSSNPVIAFTSFPNYASQNIVERGSDHRYHYASWNKTSNKWVSEEIAYGGTALYRNQEYYSGGIAINPLDTNVVYLSSNVNVKTKNPHGKYEIYSGTVNPSDGIWSWKQITTNSSVDNIRPIIPRQNNGNNVILWLASEKYTEYVNYDVNKDGRVDHNDDNEMKFKARVALLYEGDLTIKSNPQKVTDILAMGIAASNKRFYYWYTDGSVSSGSLFDHNLYRINYPYTKPAGNVVRIAVNGSNDHVYTWYENLTYSVGGSDNLERYKKAVPYTLSQGKAPSDVVGIAIAKSNDYVYVWYKDGTVTAGTPDKLDAYRSSYRYVISKDKNYNDIIDMAIGEHDRVYTIYKDNSYSVGSSQDLALHSKGMSRNLPITTR